MSVSYTAADHGQFPWRTQAEIPAARQQTLRERLAVVADTTRGVYPFRGFTLSRADVEWLLVIQGPIAWGDETQRQRWGLDLRGALLCGEDLSGLPLARLRGGLTVEERHALATRLPPETVASLTAAAAIYLVGAKLRLAHLEGAVLRQAHLEGADLTGALMGVSEESGFLDFSHEARKKTGLYEAQLKGTDLREAHLEGAILSATKLERAVLIGAHAEGADFFVAHLEGAFINEGHFGGKRMDAAQLAMVRAYLPDFPEELPPADLRGVFFDAATSMWNAVLWNPQHRDRRNRQVVARFADARWSGANVAVIDWNAITMLGDEYDARGFTPPGNDKPKARAVPDRRAARRKKLDDYLAAVRTYRQVAAALQAQGSNEDASKFSYRAQFLQRQVLRRQGRIGQYIFSILLDSLAGYGYRPVRSLVAYATIIVGFMGLYLLNAHFVAPHLTWDEAVVLSISSFHGRGFFTQQITLGDTYARLAALEAVIGLLIEISFIATFTQRFFGK